MQQYVNIYFTILHICHFVFFEYRIALVNVLMSLQIKYHLSNIITDSFNNSYTKQTYHQYHSYKKKDYDLISSFRPPFLKICLQLHL